MKFKKGRITLVPSVFLPMSFEMVPDKVLSLDSALATQ
jgi:hypothetical protein